MTHILSIETSTGICSVALQTNGQVIASREDSRRNSHSANITLFIDAVVKEAGLSLSQIDAVAVGKGPGSYTGLRIGVSAAKGLCYALSKPLIALNSLQTMACNPALLQYTTANTLLCPMIDARRMEVYCALYNPQYNVVKETEALIIDSTSFGTELAEQQVVFFGDGADKCRDTIQHPNAVFVADIYPSALHNGILAFEAYTQQRFEDVAYFEPFYLKEFVGTVAKQL